MLTPADLKAAKDATLIVKQMVETAVLFFKNLQRNGSKNGNVNGGARFKPKRTDRVNTILLIGMEGVGKTELIRNCFGHQDADSSAQTEAFELYTSRPSDGRACWVNIADYMGQNLGMLVTKFI